MANLQYIGARYVPIVFDNPDDHSANWKSGISYENLVIVTYLDDSYTSRKPVPRSVGNPADNPDYWAKTGDFNAALTELQGEVEEIKRNKTTNYNTVADMIADSDNINVGDYVQTRGYYTPNDGGGALYEIKSNSPKWCVINLNGKVAENVSEIWYAEQFGIHHDGITPNDDILSTILNSYYDYGKTLYFHEGDVLVNDTIVFSRPIRIVGNNTRFVINDATKPAINTRQSMSIYIVGFRFNTFAHLIYEADAKANMDKEIFLEEIYYESISGEPINRGLLISSKRPPSYDDNSGGTYSRYPLEILNFSGYNALMITNENISREDDETVVGATDNSAIGIIDRVVGVASPTLLIDTHRSGMEVKNDLAAYKSTTLQNCVFNVDPSGHIAIGCSALNADNEFSGVADIKIYDQAPTIAMKSAITGNSLSINLASDANGTVRVILHHGADSYIPIAIVRNRTELNALLINESNNSGVILRLTSDPSILKNIYVDSNKYLRCANYETMSTEDDGTVIQTSLHGDSASRPSLNNHYGNIGFQYFDTTLNKPIWWKGNAWVDATGATV